MNKIITYTIIGLVVLTAVLGISAKLLYDQNQRLKEDNTRLEDNYIAQVEQTVRWKLADSTNVATAKQLLLTAREAMESKDAEIQKLVATNKKLGNKIKNLEYALSIESDTTFDTITNVVEVRVYDTVVREIDSLTIGKLTIVRERDFPKPIAKYSVRYNPVISAFIHTHKEGKWKIKNIFKPRKVTNYVDVVSDDKLINVKNITLLKLKK